MSSSSGWVIYVTYGGPFTTFASIVVLVYELALSLTLVPPELSPPDLVWLLRISWFKFESRCCFFIIAVTAVWSVNSLFNLFGLLPVINGFPRSGYCWALFLAHCFILLHMSRNSKWAPVSGQMYRSLLMVGPNLIPWANASYIAWFIIFLLKL